MTKDIDNDILQRLTNNDILKQAMRRHHLLTPDLAGLPEEEKQRQLKVLSEHEKYQRFQVFAEKANEITTLTLRSGGHVVMPFSTFEDRQTEAKSKDITTIRCRIEQITYEKEQNEQASAFKRDLISETNRRSVLDKGNRSILFHFPGGSDTKVIDTSQGWDEGWKKHQKETEEELQILEAWHTFLDAVIAMYEEEIKSRDKPETVSAIVKEAEKLDKKKKELTQKIRKIIRQFNKTPAKKDSKITVYKIALNNTERIRIIQGELSSLRKQFNMLQIPSGMSFPLKQEPFSSDELRTLKEIESFYRTESRKLNDVGGTMA